MQRARCNMIGCTRQHYARGWCKPHYEQWRKNQDGDLPPADRMTVEERFWSYVDQRGPDDCWLWRGSTSAGYGRFTPEHGVRVRAHRFAFELRLGPVPEELQLDHVCHNRDRMCPGGVVCVHRRCANPAHLEPVTQIENLQRAHQRRIPA